MSAAAFLFRHARAISVGVAALVAAGIVAAVSLPSSIYPPLEFPRIVIVAKSGTRPPT